ncbi:MAG: hypothetical protein JJ899_17335 [Alphaproteobacteria bacterium]|nr:hypothetical protein [Alphaproteobacteria bacterium]
MSRRLKRRTAVTRAENASEEFRYFFDELSTLFEKEVSPSVCLAYMFFRLEQGQNNALYCGLVKNHQVDKEIAISAIDGTHMTRKEFREFYKNIFGRHVPKDATERIVESEKIRDRLMHGKQVKDSEMYGAIVDVVDYVEALNEHVSELAGVRPFGPTRGFKGAGKSLPKSTSRLVVKGLDFTIG